MCNRREKCSSALAQWTSTGWQVSALQEQSHKTCVWRNWWADIELYFDVGALFCIEQQVSPEWDLPGTSKKKAVGLSWLGALTPVVYNGLFQRFPPLSQQLKQYFIKLMTSEPQWYKRLLPPVCGCVSVSEKLLNAERREWKDFYTHFPSWLLLKATASINIIFHLQAHLLL